MMSKRISFSFAIRMNVVFNLVRSLVRKYCSSVIIDFHQLSSTHNILSTTENNKTIKQ